MCIVRDKTNGGATVKGGEDEQSLTVLNGGVFHELTRETSVGPGVDKLHGLFARLVVCIVAAVSGFFHS